MYNQNYSINDPDSRIIQLNQKRRRLSNFLRILTFILIFGDFFGFGYIFGIPSFVYALALIFLRGWIVKKVYPIPQDLQYMIQQQKLAQQHVQSTGYMYNQNPQQSNVESNITEIYDILYCESCGEQYIPGSSFCESCGAKL